MMKSSMVKGFLLSETSVTVYSAILITPIVLGLTAKYSPQSIPVWILLVVVGFILFVISSSFSGYVRAFISGAAIGMFLNALLSTSIGSRLTAQLGRFNPGGA